MITFSQQDSRWSNLKFGGGYSIGRYGCVITDLAMIRDWFYNFDSNPIWVSQQLSYSNGLVIWSSLPKVGLSLVRRVYGRNDTIIKSALAAPDQCCILQVNNNHWLFLIGRQLPVLGYRVVDPWTGQICYTNKYGNNITGCAVIGK